MKSPRGSYTQGGDFKAVSRDTVDYSADIGYARAKVV
jgi:hypothetical protein